MAECVVDRFVVAFEIIFVGVEVESLLLVVHLTESVEIVGVGHRRSVTRSGEFAHNELAVGFGFRCFALPHHH